MLKRLVVVAGVTVCLLGTPLSSEAGVKSTLKKIGHVATRTVEGIAVVAAVIVFCSSGACN